MKYTLALAGYGQKMVDQPWKDPHANIHVGLPEGHLPILKVTLYVYSIGISLAGARIASLLFFSSIAAGFPATEFTN